MCVCVCVRVLFKHALNDLKFYRFKEVVAGGLVPPAYSRMSHPGLYSACSRMGYPGLCPAETSTKRCLCRICLQKLCDREASTFQADVSIDFFSRQLLRSAL